MFVAFVSYETQCLGWYLSVKDTLLFVSCHHHKNISKGKWLSSFLWEQPLVLLMCRSNKDRKDVDIEQLGGTLVRLVQTKWQCYRVSGDKEMEWGRRWGMQPSHGFEYRIRLLFSLKKFTPVVWKLNHKTTIFFHACAHWTSETERGAILHTDSQAGG